MHLLLNNSLKLKGLCDDQQLGRNIGFTGIFCTHVQHGAMPSPTVPITGASATGDDETPGVEKQEAKLVPCSTSSRFQSVPLAVPTVRSGVFPSTSATTINSSSNDDVVGTTSHDLEASGCAGVSSNNAADHAPDMSSQRGETSQLGGSINEGMSDDSQVAAGGETQADIVSGESQIAAGALSIDQHCRCIALNHFHLFEPVARIE
ncbi:hypothetical protein V6N11_053542 [Hibiscus sabdariffa]|uniref:Uncharacterized protein n=1 Tax=Hibiscus sabdariffa TaxID=183260 RepID=A0ABR2UDT3_9ROSI